MSDFLRIVRRATRFDKQRFGKDIALFEVLARSSHLFVDQGRYLQYHHIESLAGATYVNSVLTGEVRAAGCY